MDVKKTYFKHLVFKGYCYFCQADTDAIWCSNCDKDIIRTIYRCPICARINSRNDTCGVCLTNPPIISNTEVLFNYEYPTNNLIKDFKFKQRSELAKVLAEKLAMKLLKKNIKLPDVLIPVPLHKTRQRNRGYNQSLEIAKHLSKKLKLKLNTNLCKRVINTDPQSSLPMKTRRKNVRNAFALNEHQTPKHIVIIDDVITTGSTINEISKLFKKAGCQRIDVWAIART